MVTSLWPTFGIVGWAMRAADSECKTQIPGQKKAGDPVYWSWLHQHNSRRVGDSLPTVQPDDSVNPLPQKGVKTVRIGCVLGFSVRTFLL